MGTFYDGTKLLSMSDLEGKRPEIYICTSNRSAGKTTYFSKLLVNKFIKNGEKFGILYRYKYELDCCADKFFKDIGQLFFKGYEMTSASKAKGVFHELYLNDEPCGYALAINSADQIKKYSHFFSDISRMFYDEFQSETNHYCNNEVKKFISIHTSVARGAGKQARYVPVYMCSNPVSILNPYYVEMGISDRLNSNVKFLRGCGYVLEQGYNESASIAQNESRFNTAFADNYYVQYAAQAVYLNDNEAFIECPKGKSRYLATLKYDGKEYAIREFIDFNIIYCDDKVDSSFKGKLSVTTEDHQINYVMLKRNSIFIDSMRYYFERGCFRFKDLRCKEALLKALSY